MLWWCVLFCIFSKGKIFPIRADMDHSAESANKCPINLEIHIPYYWVSVTALMVWRYVYLVPWLLAFLTCPFDPHFALMWPTWLQFSHFGQELVWNTMFESLLLEWVLVSCSIQCWDMKWLFVFGLGLLLVCLWWDSMKVWHRQGDYSRKLCIHDIHSYSSTDSPSLCSLLIWAVRILYSPHETFGTKACLGNVLRDGSACNIDSTDPPKWLVQMNSPGLLACLDDIHGYHG